MPRKTRLRLVGYSLVGTLILLAVPVSSQAESQGKLTLEAALEHALQNSLELQVIRTELGVARGVLTQAQTYPFNPALELEGNGGRARTVDSPVEHRTVGGFSVGLSQVIEIKGQRGIRTDIATANLTQTQWEIRDAERRVLADVGDASGMQADATLRSARRHALEAARFRTAGPAAPAGSMVVRRLTHPRFGYSSEPPQEPFWAEPYLCC